MNVLVNSVRQRSEGAVQVYGRKCGIQPPEKNVECLINRLSAI